YQVPVSLPACVLAVLLLTFLIVIAGMRRKTFACCCGIAFVAALFVFHERTIAVWTAALGSLPTELQSSFFQRQPFTSLAAPLAISFFAFEFIHYLMEVSGGAPSIKDPLRFSLFSVFWPSIVAGPVKRYKDFLPALHR